MKEKQNLLKKLLTSRGAICSTFGPLALFKIVTVLWLVPNKFALEPRQAPTFLGRSG